MGSVDVVYLHNVKEYGMALSAFLPGGPCGPGERVNFEECG